MTVCSLGNAAAIALQASSSLSIRICSAVRDDGALGEELIMDAGATVGEPGDGVTSDGLVDGASGVGVTADGLVDGASGVGVTSDGLVDGPAGVGPSAGAVDGVEVTPDGIDGAAEGGLIAGTGALDGASVTAIGAEEGASVTATGAEEGALDGATENKVGALVGAFEGMERVVGAPVGRKATIKR